MESPNPVSQVSSVRLLIAALVVLGAICWGGGTTLSAQVAILGVLGLLFLLAPAGHRLPRGYGWLALAWLALAGAAFLPAAWFETPTWRTRFAEAGIALPSTLTPQPALTLEALVWLVAGLAWLGWLTPTGDGRRTTMRVLAVGIAMIAALALGAQTAHWHVPGWLSDPHFGPFPNRNHTGHVLALGGIFALGCAADAARRRTWRAAPWLVTVLVISAALVVNHSRGGVLLLLGSAGLWAAIEAWQRRSWKIVTLAAAALLAGTATVLLTSHTMAGRFAGGADSQIGFRMLVWRDTLEMIHAAPWCGDGLGNFRELFPIFREASIIQQAIRHPESDWLWLATDMSWIGVGLAAAIFIVFARDTFPLARGTHRRLRTVALAAAIGAALHGLIDVPAHRPGSALLALMALALARQDPNPVAAPMARWVWRVIGVLLIGCAVALSRVQDEVARTEALMAAGDATGAAAAAEKAISRAPLEWRGYYARALVAANDQRVLAALGDFRRARLLEPHLAIVPLEEGRVWARLVPSLALPAWSDALSRVGPPQDAEIFGTMVDAAPKDPAFLSRLFALTKDHPELHQKWRHLAPPTERETPKAE